MLKCASFFAGVGGIDLGFKQAGFETIYADEFDMILMTDDGTVYVTEGIRDRFRTKGKMEVLYREEP